MLSKRALACLVCLAVAGACSTPPAPCFAGYPSYGQNRHFAVIGDLQRTMFWGWVLNREQNDAERKQLLIELARTDPAFVVMLGDMVADGSSVAHWQEFDDNAESLRRARIPVFAVPGNHEYLVGGRAGLRHYFARLPHLANQNWYSRRYGSLGLVFLDSNAGPLTTSEWDVQRKWYESTLSAMDEAPELRGVVVFLHHAPFTNSCLVRDDVNVQQAFLPAFLRARKTLAMVTGHAHGYERFERDRKAFIVSGGGGGPRFPLLQGAKRRHADDKYDGPAIRNFNFVEFTVDDGGLHADVIGLPKGSHTFCRMDGFDLPWPSAAASPTEIEHVRIARELVACERAQGHETLASNVPARDGNDDCLGFRPNGD